MIKKQLGERVRAYRLAKGISQESLAELSDYSADFIGLIERGVYAPSIEGCERIAGALRIQVSELFQFNEKLPAPPTKPAKDKQTKRPRGRPRLG